MKNHSRKKIVLRALAVTAIVSIALATAITEPTPDRPNFLLILADDQGWTGTSVQMDDRMPNSRSDFYQTPSLERLASQGMRFSNAYAPSPNCSPTRCSILTGMSPARLHMTDIVGRNSGPLYEGNRLIPPPHINDIPSELSTIPELLKRFDDRYVTGHFGKWHLEGEGPGKHGFDVHRDEPGGRSKYLRPGDSDFELIFGITDEAIAFLEQRAEDESPFFLQVSHYAVHLPADARKQTIDRTLTRTPGDRHTDVMHAAMTEDLDSGVGLLLSRLEELGLGDNTYVIYYSDNGAYAQQKINNLPLANGKASVWEGGIRVPLILRGPGIQAGSINRTPAIGWDLLPTILDLAGDKDAIPENVDGGSLRELLERPGGGEVERSTEGLVFYFPHYNHDNETTPQSAIRVGDYKLIHFYETGESRLYNVVEDIEERYDLSDRMDEKAADLKRLLDNYLADVEAGLPTVNARFDPRRDPKHERRR
jgi:arylsulfatase A